MSIRFAIVDIITTLKRGCIISRADIMIRRLRDLLILTDMFLLDKVFLAITCLLIALIIPLIIRILMVR